MQSCCPLMGPTMCNICSWCHARSCVPEMPWCRPWHFWCSKPCPDTHWFRSDVINIAGDPVALMKHFCLPIRLATAASHWDQQFNPRMCRMLMAFLLFCCPVMCELVPRMLCLICKDVRMDGLFWVNHMNAGVQGLAAESCTSVRWSVSVVSVLWLIVCVCTNSLNYWHIRTVSSMSIWWRVAKFPLYLY